MRVFTLVSGYVGFVRCVTFEQRRLSKRIVIYDDIRRLGCSARMRIRAFVVVFSDGWHDDLCRQWGVFHVLRTSV